MSTNSEWWRDIGRAAELKPWLPYIERGLHAFPLHGIAPATLRCLCGNPNCASPGKHPCVDDWENVASCDRTLIEYWSRRFLGCNIAWALGRDGYAAIDVDPRNNGDESFARLEQKLGPLDTARQKTGSGGEHQIVRLPTGVALQSRSQAFGLEYPGVDFKTTGGYIVVPPSRHASGNHYAWDAGAPQAVVLPQSWVDALLAQQNGAGRKRIAGVDDNERIPQGRRRDSLKSLAGRLRHNGMTAGAIYKALIAVATEQCDPSYTTPDELKDLRRIADDFQSYEPAYAIAQQAASNGANKSWATIERTASQIIANPPPPASFDIELMLPSEDGPAILFGLPGALKSWVGLHIAICMALPAPVFGRFGAKARYKSIYVNLDAGRNPFERRVLRIGKALENVIVLTPDSYDASKMGNLLERHPGAFVVIDAFADMYHVDRTKDAAEAARDFLQNLRTLYAKHGCNGVVIDHPHRPREGSPDGDYYGSIQKLASIRTMWQIVKYGDPKERLAKITCRKMNEAEFFPAFVVKADFSDGGFALTYDDGLSNAIAQSVQVAEPDDTQRIVAALTGVPDGLSRRQLQRATGLSRERVLEALTEPSFIARGAGRARRYVLLEIERTADDSADDSENNGATDLGNRTESYASLRGRNDTYDSPEPDIMVPEADDTANDSADDDGTDYV